MTFTAIELKPSQSTTPMSSDPQSMDRPISTPGPHINNTPTIISLLSPTQLRQYPYLRQLKNLINAAFSATHSKDGIFPPDVKRLNSDTQIIDEIGPDFFTYIILSRPSEVTDRPTLFATASARRLLPKDYTMLPESLKLLKRSQASAPEDVESWELKLLAVDPSIQRQGLASMLMKLLEVEIQKRSAESRLNESMMISQNAIIEPDGGTLVMHTKPKELRFLLDTVKEVNEEFYRRRGFVTTEELAFEPGVIGGMGRFTEVFMEKILTQTEGPENGAEFEMANRLESISSRHEPLQR